MAAFVTLAIESKLSNDRKSADERPWLAFAGAFRDAREESERIMARVNAACEVVDEGEWE